MLSYPTSFEERVPLIHEGILFLPDYYPTRQEEALALFEKFVGKEHLPLALEICSGNGSWIAQKAKEDPSRLWIAVEKKLYRAAKIARLAKDLPNLKVVCGDARAFIEFYLPERSLSEFFINFPDPWPKSRHSKHRLMEPRLLSLLASKMTLAAPFTFVSDDLDYATETLEALKECGSFTALKEGLSILLKEEHGSSFFHNLWLSKGKTIYAVKYVR